MPWELETYEWGSWSVTIDSDGKQVVRHCGRERGVFFWGQELAGVYLSHRVARMVYEQRDAYRHCFRLHRSFRIGTVYAKRTRVRWLAENRHLGWTSYGHNFVKMYSLVCDSSQYLPV